VPTYEFRCPECGDRFDLVRPMADAADPADCPRCGGAAVRKLSFQGSTHGLAAATRPPGPVSSVGIPAAAAIPNYHGDPTLHDHHDHAPGALHDHSHDHHSHGDHSHDHHSHDHPH